MLFFSDITTCVFCWCIAIIMPGKPEPLPISSIMLVFWVWARIVCESCTSDFKMSSFSFLPVMLWVALNLTTSFTNRAIRFFWFGVVLIIFNLCFFYFFYINRYDINSCWGYTFKSTGLTKCWGLAFGKFFNNLIRQPVYFWKIGILRYFCLFIFLEFSTSFFCFFI